MNTLHRRTLHQLGEAICLGQYRPGDVLPAEPILGERLGVSRIVVREVIKSLASKGMIEVRRKTGTVVLDSSRWSLFDPDIIAWRANTATMNEGMAKELMELRSIVEPAACRFAAQRITGDERLALRAAFDAMQRAIGGDGDYVAADLAFHTTILKACRNQFVQQMQNAMAAILQTSFEIVSATPGGPARSLPMHLALCQAIEGGDADAAERTARTIIAQAECELLQRLAAPHSTLDESLPSKPISGE
jgi:GntR family galactonate operon transcriptional repressor